MGGVTLMPSGGGELVGDTPHRRVEILSEEDALHATWSLYGPHREGADLHIHHHHTDLFYVLGGELTVRLGTEDQPATLSAGTLARVPPFVVHGFRNAGDAEVRYLNFHAPGHGFADFLRGLRDGRTVDFDQHPPPPNGTRPPTEAAVGEQLFAADDVTLLADVDQIGIAEARGGARILASPRHVHQSHVESFYVLEGELTVAANGRELRADAGSWLQIPPGVPHAVSAGARARVLNIHTPNCSFGGFVRGDETAFDQTPAG